MQIFLWLYLVASLKMVTSKMEPLSFSTREEEIVSPIFSHRRKSVPSSEFDEKSLSFLDWNNLDPKSSMVNLVLKNFENQQLEDVEEFSKDDSSWTGKQIKDSELLELFNFLKELLQQTGTWKAPLVVFDESLKQFDDRMDFLELENQPKIKKRSRYYRRYPWKRQNSRSKSTHDYDGSQYLCTPSKKEVYELLVALHSARQGNTNEGLRFCNRHRLPGTVFSNIRFIGRRK